VVPRDAFGEWLKIDTPPSASLWISVEYVRRSQPSPHGSPSPPAPVTDPPETQALVRLPPLEISPTGPVSNVGPNLVIHMAGSIQAPDPKRLVPLAGQGDAAEFVGILRRTHYLLNRPAKFRLVASVARDAKTRCYVRGSAKQLKRLLGRKLTVQGKEYWMQDVNYPVLVPVTVILEPK
jgi:hypothetical protein